MRCPLLLHNGPLLRWITKSLKHLYLSNSTKRSTREREIYHHPISMTSLYSRLHFKTSLLNRNHLAPMNLIYAAIFHQHYTRWPTLPLPNSPQYRIPYPTKKLSRRKKKKQQQRCKTNQLRLTLRTRARAHWEHEKKIEWEIERRRWIY